MTAFSVVVPFRNAAPTLAQAAASILAQTCAEWEAIFVDDGSEDGSADIVAGLASHDRRIVLLTQGPAPARGVAATRNIGIAASQGRYVAFLDADDLWEPEKLALQLRAFQEHDERIVFTSYRRFSNDGLLSTVAAPLRVTWRDALSGNPIGCLTAAFDTAFYGRAQMPLLPMHEDYAFWLALLRQGSAARGLPQILAHYRVSGGSASANKIRAVAAVWRILGMQGLSLPARLRGMAGYATGALGKRF